MATTPSDDPLTSVQRAEGAAMASLRAWLDPTFAFPPPAYRPVLPNGLYASVIPAGDTWIAIATDGVGTKLLVAGALGRYDTVGIDCIAMNVNDLLCVGATPVALVDYVAVGLLDAAVMEGLARGLHEGARQSSISIPGGETAVVPELLHRARRGQGPSFDLAGTAIGVLPPDRLVLGAEVAAGDVLVGLASSGLHSNGFTLARRALLRRARLSLAVPVPELGCPLGEELLRPTRIYVPLVLDLWRRSVPVRALYHVTGGGLLNLCRSAGPVGYLLDYWPDPPAIFRLIQRLGRLADTRMFSTFNMGVGFALAVPEAAAQSVLDRAAAHGVPAWPLGHAVADPGRRVRLRPLGLLAEAGRVRRVRTS
ncbi:MAG: phosphoribosylformylglycinamidine cyclo-ligase [Chloroflexi bacterium]|nr:phosphoribosylformylglycinamidine cyclo-ligase [Chloroflexota bacterium]